MNKQEIKQLSANTANIKTMVEDIKDIKLQVSNHIPTAIAKLRSDMDKRDREQVEKNNKAMVQLAGITSTVIILSQVVFFFISK